MDLPTRTVKGLPPRRTSQIFALRKWTTWLAMDVYIRDSDKAVMTEVAPHQSVTKAFVNARGRPMVTVAPTPTKKATATKAGAPK